MESILYFLNVLCEVFSIAKRDYGSDYAHLVNDLCVFYNSYRNVSTGEQTVVSYKGQEDVTVLQIKLLGDEAGADPLNCVCIMLRVTVSLIIMSHQCIILSTADMSLWVVILAFTNPSVLSGYL